MSNSSKLAAFSRTMIADALLQRLDEACVQDIRRQFAQSPATQWFSVDDLLPQDMAREIHAAFPQPSQMRERKTLREHKYVAAQMDRYHPQAEEALFAFHDERVVARVGEVTQLAKLQADPELYAGGISLMMQGNFLNPHLDNSHNNDRSLYRVLNLLYYVSPGWSLASGGHLEVWPCGLNRSPQMIPSLFNRLVVMATGPQSWHSVTRVKSTDRRCCVSNYYFSSDPIGNEPYFRVTSFRGRPEQPIRDLVLRADSSLRQAIRKLRPQGIHRTTHLYKKPSEG